MIERYPIGSSPVLNYCYTAYTMQQDFHGVKIALIVGDKVLMHLRDNKPGLFNANMWDFPGGGREGQETSQECAIREVQEEFGINLSQESIIWEKIYPAQKDPNQKAFFMVGKISEEDMNKIILMEGQRWDLFDQETFFAKEDVIPALKVRFSDYLQSKK